MKHGWELAVGLLVLFNLIGIIAAIGFRTKQRRRDMKQQETLLAREAELDRYREVLTVMLKSNHLLLDGNLCLTGPNDEHVRLDKLLSTFPRLILYLDENHCDSCVDLLLFSLKKAVPEIGYGNFLILYSDREYPSKWLNIRVILPEATIFRLVDQVPDIPASSSHVPVLFVCDSSLRAESPLPVLPEMEDLTTAFLEIMINRYFPKKPIP